MTSPIQHATIIRITEAAKLLKCSKSSVRRLCESGILRPVARTQGRHRRFTREEVLRVRAVLLSQNTDEVRAARLEKRRKARATSRVLKDAKRWQKIERWIRDHSVAKSVVPRDLAVFVLNLVPKTPRKA